MNELIAEKKFKYRSTHKKFMELILIVLKAQIFFSLAKPNFIKVFILAHVMLKSEIIKNGTKFIIKQLATNT